MTPNPQWPAVERPQEVPDWLNPMWVKELRQGLRSPLFLWVFLSVQASMLCMVLATLAGDEIGFPREWADHLFWGGMATALLFGYPLMAMNAMRSEITGHTMELVLMSHLSPRAVLTGKWVSLFSQAALLVVTIFPYLVVRYAAGGVNIVSETLALLAMLFGSGILIALGLGAAPYLGKILHYLVPIGLAALLWFGHWIGREIWIHEVQSWTFQLGWIWLLPICLAVAIALCVLEIGVAKIAPPTQNHSGMVRVYGMVILGFFCLPLLGEPGPLLALTLLFSSAILFLVASYTLMESARPTRGAMVPFVRYGKPGIWCARIFAPGPHTGLVYTSIMLGIMVVVWSRFLLDDLDPHWFWFSVANIVALLFFGPALALILANKIPNPLMLFAVQIILQIAWGIAVLILLDMDTRVPLDPFLVGALSSPLPLSNLVANVEIVFEKYPVTADGQYLFHLGMPILILILSLNFLILRARRLYHEQSRVAQEALHELQTQHPRT